MIAPPEPLSAVHDVSGFSCGEATLDVWLRRRALSNQQSGASRTYVLPEEGRVIAYYALAAGAVATGFATGRVRRNMPDPVPVMVLGRLAVDVRCQGRGLGHDLLRDAMQRTLAAADIAGIRALVVHAVSERAGVFYRGAGFVPSPLSPQLYMVTLAEVRAALGMGSRP